MAKLTLPRQLTNYTNLIADFESHATTIQSALDELVDTFPLLRNHLYNNDKTVRNFISIFINGQMADNLNLPIPPDSHIHIITAVAGG